MAGRTFVRPSARFARLAPRVCSFYVPMVAANWLRDRDEPFLLPARIVDPRLKVPLESGQG
jgi:hypothetical protein